MSLEGSCMLGRKGQFWRAPMAVRRIRQLGDPILRVRCTPVEDPKSPAVRLLSDDLRDTLRAARKKYNMGRALAAPQIGAPVRVVLVEVGKFRACMVNPEITDVEGQDRDDGSRGADGRAAPTRARSPGWHPRPRPAQRARPVRVQGGMGENPQTHRAVRTASPARSLKPARFHNCRGACESRRLRSHP